MLNEWVIHGSRAITKVKIGQISGKYALEGRGWEGSVRFWENQRQNQILERGQLKFDLTQTAAYLRCYLLNMRWVGMIQSRPGWLGFPPVEGQQPI